MESAPHCGIRAPCHIRIELIDRGQVSKIEVGCQNPWSRWPEHIGESPRISLESGNPLNRIGLQENPKPNRSVLKFPEAERGQPMPPHGFIRRKPPSGAAHPRIIAQFWRAAISTLPELGACSVASALACAFSVSSCCARWSLLSS